jgi:SOS response regulatory protein OraA/RecX
VPTITALRADPRGRVAVELDGAPWRLLPTDVVARAGLTQGRVLDRQALRLVRRELRRAEALSVAGRALRARDLSTRDIAERLERAGVAPAAREHSVATLTHAGLVDDGRFSRNRAESLARRGFGDAAIRHELRRHGVPSELVEAALRELESEAERAGRIIEARGSGPRTARYLAGKGFGEEAVEAAFANYP